MTYTIRVERKVIHSHVIEVYAHSLKEAKELAIHIADERGDSMANTEFGDWKAKAVDSNTPEYRGE